MISSKKIAVLLLSMTLLGCLCTPVHSNVDVVNDESIDVSADEKANDDVTIEEQVCTENDPTNPNCQSNGKEDKVDVEVKVDTEPDYPHDYEDVPMLWDDDDDIADDDEIGSDYYDDDFEDGDMPFDEMDEHDDELCKDNHELCEKWADMGECDNNPNYMRTNCQRSCQTCAKNNHYGIAQLNSEDQENYEEIRDLLAKMENYMQNEIRDNPDLRYLFPRCKNRHAECAFWAHIGECDANPSYMLTNCAPVCNTCHLLDFKTRCPIKPGVEDALKSGDLHKMFERIVDERNFGNVSSTVLTDKGVDLDGSSFEINVLSRPEYANGDTKETADYKIGPWVITIDNFVHEKECEKLIELGGLEGYERSEDVGKELFDGTYDSVQSTSRTSFNAWCQSECYHDPIAKAVAARIEELTGVPEQNSENFQLLRYHVGQFYKTHHDYIDNQEEFPAGPRLLTAFLYLNDVEGGGGTNFPRLDLTVMPKRGRLLLWPSVLNAEPLNIDRRTHHQALPVEKGVKYAANAWLHMRDFKEPNDRNCT